MQVKFVQVLSNPVLFEDQINDAIKLIEDMGEIILDIEHKVVQNHNGDMIYTALISYDNPAEFVIDDIDDFNPDDYYA